MMTKQKQKRSNQTKHRSFYWLIGDRFFCNDRCKQIIKLINKNNNWDIQSIDNDISADKFCACLSSSNLFGEDNTIFILKSNIPETAKTFKFILQLPQNKVLICINNKLKKNTVLFKNLKDKTCIEEYPSVIENNRINYRLINQVKKNIKSATQWDGEEEIFNKIIEMSNYDYGIAINEIEKLRIYSNNDIKNLSLQQSLNILTSSTNMDINKLVKLIKSKNTKEAFILIQNFIDNNSVENIYQIILGSLIDDYTFSLACCIALEKGFKSTDKIAKFVSSFYLRKGEEVTEDYVISRYYYYSKILPYKKSERIASDLIRIEKAMDLCTFSSFPKRTILLSLIFELMSEETSEKSPKNQ